MKSGLAWIGALLAMAAVASAQNLPAFNAYKGTVDLTGAVKSGELNEAKFPIACWLASYYDLGKWSQRGINIAWSNQWTNPRERTLREYVGRANNVGIKLWRYPGKYMETPMNAGFDAYDKTLAAYSLIDEPVLHNLDPDAIANQARMFRECNPKMKLILNLEGDKFVMPNPRPEVIEQYTRYMDACDIGFVDWYVKNRDADRYPLSHLWTAVERLIIWGGGKPVGAFIECSNQKITAQGREPTPGEMRGEIIGSIIHGARLIAYFPEVPGRTENKGKSYGNANDGTPPALEKEMVKINRQLQQLAPVLLSPGARLATMDAPLIGAVRWYKGTQYLIVLNTDAQQSATFNNEAIKPCDWRIYSAGAAPDPSTTPEPDATPVKEKRNWADWGHKEQKRPAPQRFRPDRFQPSGR